MGISCPRPGDGAAAVAAASRDAEVRGKVVGNPSSCIATARTRSEQTLVIASDVTSVCVRVYRQSISRELPRVWQVDGKRGFLPVDGSF